MKFSKINKYLAKNIQGFSLIESLVAISILLLALTGTLTIASRSIIASANSRDQITAFFLGSEAVEFVRNTRDNNILVGNSWLDGLDECMSGSCTIDSPNNAVGNCAGTCQPLLITEAGVYNQINGEPTIFRREISINEVASGREVVISVTTTWKRRLIERTLTTEERLFNWQ